jgi:hypothetical protein
MGVSKLDLLQGTLDVMVLQTLEVIGPLHGYGIARRIEQVSSNEVLLNQGTIYASLVRLQQRGWTTTGRRSSIRLQGRAKSSWRRMLPIGNGCPQSWGGFFPCRAREAKNESLRARSIQSDAFLLPQTSA